MIKVLSTCDIYRNSFNGALYAVDYVGNVIATRCNDGKWRIPKKPVCTVQGFIPLQTDCEIEIEADLAAFDLCGALSEAMHSPEKTAILIPHLRVLNEATRDLFFTSTRVGKVFAGCAAIVDHAVENGLVSDTAQNRKAILISMLGYYNAVEIKVDANNVITSREYLVK